MQFFASKFSIGKACCGNKNTHTIIPAPLAESFPPVDVNQDIIFYAQYA
jgi:hypothetical protein